MRFQRGAQRGHGRRGDIGHFDHRMRIAHRGDGELHCRLHVDGVVRAGLARRVEGHGCGREVRLTHVHRHDAGRAELRA